MLGSFLCKIHAWNPNVLLICTMSYLLNQTSYIAAQKKPIKAQEVYFSFLKLYIIYFMIVTNILMSFWKISNIWWVGDIKKDKLALIYRNFLTGHRAECCKLYNLVQAMYFLENILSIAYCAISVPKRQWFPKQHHFLFLLC